MPTKLGVPIADIGAGMFAAYAIAAALLGRERDPEHLGQKVDTSMLGGQVAMLTYQAGIHFTTGETPGLIGNRHPIITPYDTFPTADGFVNIAVGNDAIWRRFCDAFGLAQERDDRRFRANADRCAHRELLYAILNDLFAGFTTAEIVALLDKAAVPCGPIHDIAEVMADPQLADQDLIRTAPHATLGEVQLTGMPYHFDRAAPEIRHGPPTLGQHSGEILEHLGYAEGDIDVLFATHAVE